MKLNNQHIYKVIVKAEKEMEISVVAESNSHAVDRAIEYFHATDGLGDELSEVESEVTATATKVSDYELEKKSFGLDTLEERVRKAVKSVVADDVKVIAIRI